MSVHPFPSWSKWDTFPESLGFPIKWYKILGDEICLIHTKSRHLQLTPSGTQQTVCGTSVRDPSVPETDSPLIFGHLRRVEIRLE